MSAPLYNLQAVIDKEILPQNVVDNPGTAFFDKWRCNIGRASGPAGIYSFIITAEGMDGLLYNTTFYLTTEILERAVDEMISIVDYEIEKAVLTILTMADAQPHLDPCVNAACSKCYS